MVYCCVPFCKQGSRNKLPGTSFHEFPCQEPTRELWIKAISRKGNTKGKLWNPNDRSVVCSNHFMECDYKPELKQKRLKPDAVPSVFSDYPPTRGKLSAMEQDTSLESDDDVKRDIPQVPLADVESVYIPEERVFSPCVPKVEVSSEDPLGEAESVFVSEEKPVTFCVPKVEVSSEDSPHEPYGVHQLTEIHKSEDTILVAPKIEPLSPPTPAAEDDEDKAELSLGCSKLLPHTCLKEEIGQQAELISQTLSVHVTKETESPVYHSGCEVDLRGGVNSSTFVSVSVDTKKRFRCAICNKEFDRKEAIRRHTSGHLGIRSFSCQICLQQFTAKSSLKTHLVLHTGERNYQCHICCMKFVRRSTLDAHYRIIHQGQKNFTCSVCSYQFSRQGDYRRHLQTHSGTEGKYKCPTCHKLFTRTFNLKIHMGTHSGERSYECSFCLKAFLRSDDLKRHLKIHTGEKNFECNICHRKFDQRCNLNRHYLTHEKKSASS